MLLLKKNIKNLFFSRVFIYMSFKEKYLKYKQKYLDLKKELELNNSKNQEGGFNENSETEEFDFKLSSENEIDQNSIEELKKQLNDIEGGGFLKANKEHSALLDSDPHEDFEFDLKLDDEDDFVVDDELTDLDELFDKIDNDEDLSEKDIREFDNL